MAGQDLVWQLLVYPFVISSACMVNRNESHHKKAIEYSFLPNNRWWIYRNSGRGDDTEPEMVGKKMF